MRRLSLPIPQPKGASRLPILVHQKRTDKWFALTSYTISRRRHPETRRWVTAYRFTQKHDVTAQMRAILRVDRDRA